jgi:hypothetical protein
MTDTPQQDSNYCLIDKLRSLNGTIEDFSAGWNGRVKNYNQHAGESYVLPALLIMMRFDTAIVHYLQS